MYRITPSAQISTKIRVVARNNDDMCIGLTRHVGARVDPLANTSFLVITRENNVQDHAERPHVDLERRRWEMP